MWTCSRPPEHRSRTRGRFEEALAHLQLASRSFLSRQLHAAQNLARTYRDLHRYPTPTAGATALAPSQIWRVVLTVGHGTVTRRQKAVSEGARACAAALT